MAFVSPEKIVWNMSLDEGMHVADFGAGSGAYAITIAKRVGDGGRVYAIDLNKDLLTKLKNDAESAHVSNIETIWGDVEEINGSKLAPNSVERVVISNILFQVEDKVGVAKEAGRILKPNGLVLVVDWSGSYGGLGPKDEHVVPSSAVRKIFLNNNFAEVKEVEAGDYHYAILFRKL